MSLSLAALLAAPFAALLGMILWDAVKSPHAIRRETPEDVASRRTANATVATAVLTGAVVIVGALQYVIFRGQLTVMSQQLTEMQSTSAQTDALIEANQKLADAAALQAQSAKDVAITAHESLFASQRAWIAPTAFAFVDLANSEQPLLVRLIYQNVGREPARKVRNFLYAGFIRGPNPPEPAKWSINPAWGSIETIKPAAMCSRVSPDINSVVYPSSTVSFALEVGYEGTILERQLLFQEVKNKRSIYFVAGCLSYETQRERKNTTFCALLMPIEGRDIAQWQFSACPIGNEDF